MDDSSDETSTFTRQLTVHSQFRSALDESGYVAVPEDWSVVVTDVVKSRQAIAAGLYKKVNMAGVAVISATMNALGSQEIPYVFGGDGAALVCGPNEVPKVREALARTCRWVDEDLALELRGAIVPVSGILEQGKQVRVAAIRVSETVNNYAFTGGGVSLAEKLMKTGARKVAPAEPGQHPDLSGLSCRWTPIETEGRTIASIIVEPVEGQSSIPTEIAEWIAALVRGDRNGHPVPESGPGFTWPPVGLELEARATRGEKSLASQKRLLYLITLLAWVLDKTGWPLGAFDPKRYRQYTALNTDYRKIQDGLRMTVSLSAEQLSKLTAYLGEKNNLGLIRFGICEQQSAVLTCFVPSITSDAHFHFIDGAGGGYAQAATAIS